MRQLTQLLPSKPVAPFPVLAIDAAEPSLVASSPRIAVDPKRISTTICRHVGRRERLPQMKETWRDIVLLERRSRVVGLQEKFM